MANNPYLKTQRLADVIAAITTLGTYRYYKLSFDQCAERIANKPADAERWGKVLSDHPEFFRIDADRKRASLVWRRQHPKCYDPKSSTELTKEQYNQLASDVRYKLSRRPLAPSEITALIGIAVSLHDRALEQHKAERWWLPILVTSLLAFAGAGLGSLLTRFVMIDMGLK